mgnify:CR=1 FL=1
MKSLKAALISALAGQGMEIFLFFFRGSAFAGGILTAISLLLSLFTAQSGKTVGQSLLSAALTLLCPLLPAMFLKKSKASGKSSLRRARKRYRAG